MMDLHFAHDFAQHGTRFVQRNLHVSTLACIWIKRRFAQPIFYQDQASSGGSKFREIDRLRSEIEGDQARRSGHGVKALDRNPKMPN